MKKVLGFVVVVAIAGLLAWRIVARVRESGGPEGPGRRGSAAVAVELAPVTNATVRDIGRFTGTLHPRSRFVVAPKVSGRLKRLTVDIGDTVQPGRLIAELDDEEYAQQVEQARAELAVAKAGVAETRSAMATAERNLDRVRSLHAKQVASAAELDTAAATYTAAEARHSVAMAEVTRREAALKGAEVRLSYTRIHALWTDGDKPRVVGERFVYEGDMLQANTLIVSIIDHATIVAAIDVIERDYPKIELDQTATLTTDGYPDRVFTGRVARIAPLLREQSRQARVEIEVPNPDRLLKPGMFARTRIEFSRHVAAVVAPVAALARREDATGVFLAEADRATARFVPVTVGIIDGQTAQILAPPLAGWVVTLGHHLLEDGAAIRLPEADNRNGKQESERATGTGTAR